MSRCVKSNLELLQALSNMSPKRVRRYLYLADKELVQSICECALNILKGNVPLEPRQKKGLCHYKHVLRKLVHSKVCWKAKRKYLVQKGAGILPALLAPILGTVISRLLA